MAENREDRFVYTQLGQLQVMEEGDGKPLIDPADLEESKKTADASLSAQPINKPRYRVKAGRSIVHVHRGDK